MAEHYHVLWIYKNLLSEITNYFYFHRDLSWSNKSTRYSIKWLVVHIKLDRLNGRIALENSSDARRVKMLSKAMFFNNVENVPNTHIMADSYVDVWWSLSEKK